MAFRGYKGLFVQVGTYLQAIAMSSSASHIRLKHPGTPFAVEHITFSLCECVIHSAVEYLFSSSEIIEGSIEKKKKKKTEELTWKYNCQMAQ